MKKFVIKISIYLGILLVIMSMISWYLLLKAPKGLLFVSNSISYNLKAGFIEKQPEKLEKAKIVVLGSSMSLSNVNAKMLQDSFQLPVINLSSWGLSISNYQQSPILDQHKIFFCNLGVPDFSTRKIELWDNFSFRTSGLRQWFNLSTNFNTSREMLSQAKGIMPIHNTRDYNSCYFDECGSVLFSDSAFNLDSTWWNKDEYAQIGVDSAKLIDYVQHLKEMTTSHHGYQRIIISFSPVRSVFYNKERSAMISHLGKLIRETCPNVYFINLFDHYYSDSEFVDGAHFNIKGANRFTGELVDSIKRLVL